MKAILMSVAVCLAGAAAHATCPPPPDHTSSLADLADAARAAQTEAEGQAVSSKMWELWTDAPNPQAQAVLDRGMSRRGSYDLLGAIEDFTALIDYCPDYAEGYNQRAFALFIQQNFAAALIDLDKALALTPLHVGALSGRALTHMQMENLDAARTDLRAALDVNPWLGERHLLAPGAPLAPPGSDL